MVLPVTSLKMLLSISIKKLNRKVSNLLTVDIEHRRNQFNPYVNNGGSVVAIAGADFVVIGGDSRLSEGYSIVTRGESKLAQMTEKTVLATSGMYADFCELKKTLNAKL